MKLTGKDLFEMWELCALEARSVGRSELRDAWNALADKLNGMMAGSRDRIVALRTVLAALGDRKCVDVDFTRMQAIDPNPLYEECYVCVARNALLADGQNLQNEVESPKAGERTDS